jgi:hypothetical protein
MKYQIILISVAMLFFSECSGKKQVLFNGGDLTGWTVFVSDSSISSNSFFYVKDGVIETPGVPNGYLRTTREFSDYRLHVEWRYPEKPTNSGIFIHTRGADKMWPIHYQCQLKHGNAGDFIVQDVGMKATVRDSVYVSTKAVKPIAPKMQAASEKQPGEWNAADITCKGDSITIVINGVLQNQASKCSNTSGGIGLQAEGSKIQFRNIWIERLK